MRRPQAAYILSEHAAGLIYGPTERADIERLVDIVGPVMTPQTVQNEPEVLQQVEVILSGWGGPRLDEAFLKRAPALRLVLYGAGAVSGIVTDASWARGVRVVSGWEANAQPVAEYSLAAILLSLKRFWWFARAVRDLQGWPQEREVTGAYGASVGVLSLGAIGRRVCELLQPFDVTVMAWDPIAPDELFTRLHAQRTDLETLFSEADVVSVHTPWLAETQGLVNRTLLERMKRNATFINTSRGAVVNESELVDVLQRRPDLQAILDVTWPEPPESGSPLYTLPNVVLTPHIAGSMGAECRRMGRYMADELRRWLSGEPLRWEVTREVAANSTHRPA